MFLFSDQPGVDSPLVELRDRALQHMQEVDARQAAQGRIAINDWHIEIVGHQYMLTRHYVTRHR